jgi:hypothetical protein
MPGSTFDADDGVQETMLRAWRAATISRGGHLPFAIQVIEIAGGRITGQHNFVDPELFAPFGLSGHLDP